MKPQNIFLLIVLFCSVLFFAGTLYWTSLPLSIEFGVEPVVRVVQRIPPPQPPEKLVWTEEDRVVQKQLEEMLKKREPPMRMVFDRSKTMTGRVVKEHPGHVVFSEQLGNHGEVSMAISRDRIVRLEERNVQIPEITLRDVRFHREFSKKKFYQRPPYTIITDETFLAVNRIVEEQKALHGRFVKWMNPLITASSRRDDMQFLIFSEKGEYEAYRSKFRDLPEWFIGFYNVQQGRLVVSHQRDAEWVKEGQKEIAGIAKEHQKKLQTDRDRYFLEQWKKKEKAKLRGRASSVTENLLRHEGAHQLAYMLGVQSPLRRDRAWMEEGLATFFETESLGGINESRSMDLSLAVEGGQIIPLRKLFALTQFENNLHYAQAWSLTCMLMQPEHRSGFFSYLDWLRNHPKPFDDPVEELCIHLSMTPNELEQRWQAYIREN